MNNYPSPSFKQPLILRVLSTGFFITLGLAVLFGMFMDNPIERGFFLLGTLGYAMLFGPLVAFMLIRAKHLENRIVTAHLERRDETIIREYMEPADTYAIHK